MIENKRCKNVNSPRRCGFGVLGRALLASMLVLSLIGLGGCEAYKVRGLVVKGKQPGVMVLGKNDDRLKQPGMPNAVVDLTLDPNTIRPTNLGAVMTDGEGRFEAPVDAAGAGLLEYKLGVLVRAGGYQDAYEEINLPGGGKVLLITLAPGRATYRSNQDLLQETIDMGKQFEN